MCSRKWLPYGVRLAGAFLHRPTLKLNIMKTLFLVLLPMIAFAQDLRVINLTSDTVLTTGLVITSPTVIQGNGYNITCNDCDPAIRIDKHHNICFFDVTFTGQKVWMKSEDHTFTKAPKKFRNDPK